MNSTALEIKNLEKTYNNGVKALKGVSFSVEESDFFALLGPNGAGKSTTIGIITSLVRKTGGTVNICGHDIDQDFSAAKACVGIVPQEFNFGIFNKVIDIVLTQAGYYGLPYKIAYPRAQKYLKQLGLWDKRNLSARTLSGGFKRRLMIARALVHNPRVLILDEPTAGVDIEIRRSMWNFLTEINQQGTTIILTTHYLEEAEQLCRNIAIIDHGEIIENTTMMSMLRKLRKEVFILDLQNPVDQEPLLNGFKVKLVNQVTLEVEIPDQRDITDLFKQLNSFGIIVSSMRNRSNRLEELFIQLTSEHHDES